jgi:hypothetical protein
MVAAPQTRPGLQVLEQRCASSQSAGSDEEPSGNGSEMPHGRSRSTGDRSAMCRSSAGSLP